MHEEKIEPDLSRQIASEGRADFFIWLEERADLTPAKNLAGKAERGRFVYQRLKATAERSQSELRSFLDQRGVNYRPFFVSNKILILGGSESLMNDLSTRPEVAAITANHLFQLQEPEITPEATAATTALGDNLKFVRADGAWSSGVTGEGIVVAGNDTGIDWRHPAIIRHYRGCLNPPDCTSVDHNYNWWDATGTYPNVPADGNGHGTHTTGTMIGDDGQGNRTGIAPGARTVQCKSMSDGGSGSEATFSECFQWYLAPWDLNGENPRPELTPDVVNNSWGYWDGNAPQFRDEIAALQAAGILVEASAGNEGDDFGCRSLRSPGDYAEVMTTGSVAFAGLPFPGNLAAHSSRGPSDLDGGYFPDVVAPGVSVWSTVPGGGYGAWTGTSMAGPHVSGLAALMWSANPQLRGQVETTMELIRNTAAPLTGDQGLNCGGDYINGPNHDWGHGTIDALKAVTAAVDLGSFGRLSGQVQDAATGQPIAGALVEANRGSGLVWQTASDESGSFEISVFSGEYTLTVSAYGYLTETVSSVSVLSGEITQRDIPLAPAPVFRVSGTIIDAATGWPLYGSVSTLQDPDRFAWTDPETGAYTLWLPSGFEHDLVARSWTEGYLAGERRIAPLVSDSQIDLGLQVDELRCMAPGYEPGAGIYTDFDRPETLAGWQVVDNAGTGAVWRFDNPKNRYNETGGTGEFAVMDSDAAGQIAVDTELRSPMIDFSGVPSVGMSFRQHFLRWPEDPEETIDVDVSNDAGQTWTNVWRHSGSSLLGPDLVQLDITVLAANRSEVMVRFRYSNAFFDWFWEIDDVVIGTPECKAPLDGGLILGNVYEMESGRPLAGAVIRASSGYSATSAITGDSLWGAGYYQVFSPSGTQVLTATLLDEYPPAIAEVVVEPGRVTRQDIYLGEDRLAVSPQSLSLEVGYGSTATTNLTLVNLGEAAIEIELYEQSGLQTGIEASDIPWLEASPSATMLPGGGDQIVTVAVNTQIPESLAPGEYQAALLVWDPGAEASIRVPVDLTVLGEPFEFEIAASDSSKSGRPGEVITYTAWLTNTGSEADAYSLSLEGNTWEAHLLSDSLNLAPGDSAPIQVTVAVPNGALGLETDQVFLTAISSGNPDRRMEVALEAVAEPVFGVALAAGDGLVGSPGEVLTHTLVVTNAGNTSDRYLISIGGNQWSMDGPEAIGPLEPGQSEEFTVSVFLPLEVPKEPLDTAYVRLVSSVDENRYADAWLYTQLAKTGSGPSLMLPLILFQ